MEDSVEEPVKPEGSITAGTLAFNLLETSKWIDLEKFERKAPLNSRKRKASGDNRLAIDMTFRFDSDFNTDLCYKYLAPSLLNDYSDAPDLLTPDVLFEYDTYLGPRVFLKWRKALGDRNYKPNVAFTDKQMRERVDAFEALHKEYLALARQQAWNQEKATMEEDSRRMKEIQNEKEERAVKFVQQQVKQKAEEDRQKEERRMMTEEEKKRWRVEQERLREKAETRKRQLETEEIRENLKRMREDAARMKKSETLNIRRQMSMQERAAMVQNAQRLPPPNGFYAVSVDESLEMLPPLPRTTTTSTPRLTDTFLPPIIPQNHVTTGTKMTSNSNARNAPMQKEMSDSSISVRDAIKAGKTKNGNTIATVFDALHSQQLRLQQERTQRAESIKRPLDCTIEAPDVERSHIRRIGSHIRFPTIAVGEKVKILSATPHEQRSMEPLKKKTMMRGPSSDERIKEILNREAPIVSPPPDPQIKTINNNHSNKTGYWNEPAARYIRPADRSRPIVPSQSQAIRRVSQVVKTAKVVLAPPPGPTPLPSISNIIDSRSMQPQPTYSHASCHGAKEDPLMDILMSDQYVEYDNSPSQEEAMPNHTPQLSAEEEQRNSTVFYTPPEEGSNTFRAPLTGLRGMYVYGEKGPQFVHM